MKKIIFVNATACTSGGVLSILNQFTENILKYNDGNVYYIFSTVEQSIDNRNIIFIKDIKGKKYLDRLLWDLIRMKRWSKKNNVKPDLIVSLQNTGVRFNNVHQIVYVHQSLPYSKESNWSVIKKDERKLWAYKNLYKLWIDFTVKKNAYVVVQTHWMREALIDRGYLKEKIVISKPNVDHIEIDRINPVKERFQYLFYPAADYKYKNHIILINAVKNIVEKQDILKGKYKIVFTLAQDSIVYKYVVEYGLEDYFEFVGVLSYEKVLSYYKGCQAVLFPSYIETFGLPLIESSIFGKKILVSDCKYSREVLSDYKLSIFISQADIQAWECEIKKAINEYEEKPCKIKQKTGWNHMFDLINYILNNKI